MHLSLHKGHAGSHVASRLSVARWRSQFWAGCITNISEHKFPTGTGVDPFILNPIARLNPLREPRTLPTFELGLVCRAPLGVFP